MEKNVTRTGRKNRRTRIFNLLLAFLLLSGLAHPALAQTGTQIRDAILGKLPANVLSMDLNDDGKVDVADLIVCIEMSGGYLAEFDELISNAVENGTFTVRVNFFPTFSGELVYTLAGTAVFGTDYAVLTGSVAAVGDELTGSLTVNNAEFIELEFVINEDSNLETTETIELTIQEMNVAQPPYFAGPTFVHTVYVGDNDEMWSGVIAHTDAGNAGLMTDIRMKIIRSDGGGLTGALVTDGMGIIPLNVTANPDTEWPLNALILNETTLSATVGPMLIDAAFAGAPTTMERNFSFAAAPQTNPEDSIELEIGTIVGTFTETTGLTGRPQFGYTGSGQFVLMKEPAMTATPEPEEPTP